MDPQYTEYHTNDETSNAGMEDIENNKKFSELRKKLVNSKVLGQPWYFLTIVDEKA